MNIILICLCMGSTRLYGGYDRLHEGSGARALQDLSGGIVQSFRLSSQDRYLTYQVLNSAVPRSTLIVASILPVSFIYLMLTLLHVYLLYVQASREL
jgi:hypothetical protein